MTKDIEQKKRSIKEANSSMKPEAKDKSQGSGKSQAHK